MIILSNEKSHIYNVLEKALLFLQIPVFSEKNKNVKNLASATLYTKQIFF